MKKSSVRITVAVIILIMLVVGYYTYLANRTRNEREDKYSLTTVEEVLSRDLAVDYPPTPKEVMRYYNEIMRCFYNEECTEEEIEKLGMKARELYDEDLLRENELESYMSNLKTEIARYREKKSKITSFSVSSSTDVDLFTEDGYSFARIRCGYNVMENKMNKPVSQVYLLRKDDEGHWKIYGWDLAENLDLNKES